MAEVDTRDLRREVLAGLTRIESDHMATLGSLETRVHGAHSEFLGKRQQLLEQSLRDLVQGERPLLLDAILGLIVMAIPVERVAAGIVGHLSRSWKLGRVLGAIKAPFPQRVSGPLPPSSVAGWQPFPKAADTVSLDRAGDRLGQVPIYRHPLKEASDRSFGWPMHEGTFLKESTKYDEALGQFAATYGNEFIDTVRATVRAAVNSLPTPLVSAEDIARGSPPARGTGSGTPAAGLLVGLLASISSTRVATQRMIAETRDAATIADDVQTLQQLKDYVQSDEFAPAVAVSIDYDLFQLFLESCFWCTTWDFSTHFQPAARPRFPLHGTTGTQLTTPPLGKKFWDYAVDRFVDPFLGDATKTYAGIGRTFDLGAVPSFATQADPGLDRFVRSSGTRPVTLDPGFYPAERLSFHFGNVLAPQLLGLNLNLATALERSQASRSQSRPPTSESDRFYQAIAEIMQGRVSRP